MPANVCTSQTATTWTRTTVELVRGLMCSRTKKNVPQRCSSVAFDFFDLSSSNLVQESSVDLWDNLNKVRGLPHNALHFPSSIRMGDALRKSQELCAYPAVYCDPESHWSLRPWCNKEIFFLKHRRRLGSCSFFVTFPALRCWGHLLLVDICG